MLYCNWFDVSYSHDLNKTKTYKECISVTNKYFQSSVCNVCPEVLMMLIDFNRFAILNIHGVFYLSIIVRISKSEAINLFKNSDLSENIGSL